jgi:hypothetical protein
MKVPALREVNPACQGAAMKVERRVRARAMADFAGNRKAMGGADATDCVCCLFLWQPKGSWARAGGKNMV